MVLDYLSVIVLITYNVQSVTQSLLRMYLNATTTSMMLKKSSFLLLKKDKQSIWRQLVVWRPYEVKKQYTYVANLLFMLCYLGLNNERKDNSEHIIICAKMTRYMQKDKEMYKHIKIYNKAF